jgi:hypothetical protein
MKIRQYDFIKRGFVKASITPNDKPVVAENATTETDSQSTFEGQEFQEAHHNVLANLIGSNWNSSMLFDGKIVTVLEMMAQVAKHTPTGNKFVSQVSGIEQLD